MKLLEKICEELGVKVGEEWRGNDGFLYKIKKDGLIEASNTSGKFIKTSTIYWEDILTGLLKPVWIPKQGEKYYVPFINTLNKNCMWNGELWGIDKIYDEIMLERNLVFKNKEDAIKIAEKMLDIMKESDK